MKRLLVLVLFAVPAALSCKAISTVVTNPEPTPTVEELHTALPTITPLPSDTPSPPPAPVSCIRAQEPQLAIVSKITDGDTISVLIAGETYSLRYIGIDTAEADQGKSSTLATTFNSELVYGQEVRLYRDVSEKDRYDRLLRYVFVGDTFVNLELVKAGWAAVNDYPPDTACSSLFKSAQQEAQQAGLGMWAKPAQTSPEPTIASRLELPVILNSLCANGCATPPQGCEIKGNISWSEEKIYHVPGQSYYEETEINPENGELWFCTESEAVANGWRKA